VILVMLSVTDKMCGLPIFKMLMSEIFNCNHVDCHQVRFLILYCALFAPPKAFPRGRWAGVRSA